MRISTSIHNRLTEYCKFKPLFQKPFRSPLNVPTSYGKWINRSKGAIYPTSTIHVLQKRSTEYFLVPFGFTFSNKLWKWIDRSKGNKCSTFHICQLYNLKLQNPVRKCRKPKKVRRGKVQETVV